MRTLYFDCSSGASGDMILGALMDLGVEPSVITDAVRGLPFADFEIGARAVSKNGVRATHAIVSSADQANESRTYADIVRLLEASRLAPDIRGRASAAFRVLAEAEAKIHMSSIDHVHFHEVGSNDAIVDIVGACAALEALAPDRVVVSPIATGRGVTESMHGTIPVPAPAVLEILMGAELYERGTTELITPTGAALLASWADSYGEIPRMTLDGVGYGAGNADLDWPNVLRVIAGEESDMVRSEVSAELIESNIDDMSPELVPYVIERVLDAGALDAWVTPIQMKKGRVGSLLSVLIERGASQPLLDVIFRETTTFGVRVSGVDREVLDRKTVEVDVEGHRVRVKVGYLRGEAVSISPEFDDAAMVARTTGLPLKEIYRIATEKAANFL